MRLFGEPDRKLVDTEIQQLLKEGIVEPSNLPWGPQVVVTEKDQHKNYLVLNYSRTVNTFIQQK